jgi:hypothetical protein
VLASKLIQVQDIFGAEVPNAIYESNLLEIWGIGCGKFGGGVWFDRFWQDLITYKITTNRFSDCQPQICARFKVIRKTAETLCTLTGDPERRKLRKYVHAQSWKPSVITNDLPPKSFESDTARYLLQAAIINGDPDVVRRILTSSDLQKDLIINWALEHIVHGPLMLAGYIGNLEILEILLSSPLCPHGLGKKKALKGAIYGGQLQAVEFITDPRWGPMNCLCAPPAIEYHLVSGMAKSEYVDFQTRLYSILRSRVPDKFPFRLDDPDVSTLLDEVAGWHEQRVDIVENLLEQGAILDKTLIPSGHLLSKRTSDPSPSYTNTSGFSMPWNPLRSAVNSSNEKIVRLLLDRGADPNTAEDMLWLAVKRGRMDIVRMLVEAGANCNKTPMRPKFPKSIRKDRIRSPIEHALMLEHKDMCQYLLDNGAVIDIGPDGVDGRRLVRRVRDEGLDSMVRFLEEHGIKDPLPNELLPPEEKEEEVEEPYLGREDWW